MSKSKRRIVIKNGVITGFSDEVDFNSLGITEIARKRVSHIRPTNWLMRQCFRIIRSLVNDKSKVAEWTRHWECSWTVYIDDKTYGPFNSRQEAIRFEKEEIYQQGKLHKSIS